MSLLKELFSLSEVKNHMDETEYTTWDSWRKACRKAYSEVTFEGDKDIAQAMYKEGRAVGEWDGSVGIVYKKPDDLKEADKLTSADAEKDGHTWMVSFTHCPGKTDKRDYTIRSVKAISSSQAVASAKAKLPADVRDCAEVDQVKMTDKKVDEGYGAFDGGKNALKRAEMKHELGHEDREAGNRTFSYSKPRAELGSFCIEIDGRCFKREGEPVKFSSKGNAEKAAATIASKDFNKGKTVKVVPLKEGLYGVAKGQVYVPADGSKDELTVLSVEPQLELATVRSKASGKESKIDCWKLAKVRYSLKENAAMQAIGQGLKSTAATKAAPVTDEVDAEVATDVNTSPAEQAANDVDETPEAQFKVGDKVTPNAGPHKDQTHSVIHVFPDGRVNLTPDGLKPDQIKYRLGAVTARANQVTLVETIKFTGSLLSQFSLMEASNWSVTVEYGPTGNDNRTFKVKADSSDAAQKAALAAAVKAGIKNGMANKPEKIMEAGARKDGFMPMNYGPKKGHKIEAYGRKGMKNTMWRKMFKSSAECEKWCQDNDATVEGSRELDDNEKA